METFKDLEIEGGPQSLDKCMSLIDEALCDGWIRDKESEKRYLCGWGRDDKGVFCIDCPKNDKYPRATVWLLQRSDAIKITNILPKEERVGNLTRPQYNNIFDDFYTKFVEKAIKLSGVSRVLSGGEKSLEDLIGREPAKLLNSFSAAANKSTGSSHPCDSARWFNFIISAHLNHSKFYLEYLREWLVKEGWSEEETSKLISKYEFARRLLATYDHK